jgi:hypothetical protein
MMIPCSCPRPAHAGNIPGPLLSWRKPVISLSSPATDAGHYSGLPSHEQALPCDNRPGTIQHPYTGTISIALSVAQRRKQHM